MSFLSRELRLIDATLLSGSGDSLRTAFGAGWIEQSSSAAGHTLSPYLSEGFLVDSSPYIAGMSRNISDLIHRVAYSAKNVQPIIKYPVRLYGNSDLIKSDEHWRAYLHGGSYGAQQYDGIFTGAEFSNHWFYYTLPHTVLEARESEQTFETIDKINLSYDYNHYIAEYEEYVDTLGSELLIPNMYMLQAASEIDDTTKVIEQAYIYYNKDVLNSISREELVTPNIWTKLFLTTEDERRRALAIEHEIPVPANMQPRDRQVRMREYLSNHYVNNPISSSTAAAITNKLQNILFDDLAIQKEFLDTLNNKNVMPYYAKVTFSGSNPGGPFVEQINQNDFSSKFLVTLRNTFGQDPITNLYGAGASSFMVQETTHLGRGTEVNNLAPQSFKTVDYGDLLNSARLTYLAAKDDYCFVGRQDVLARKAAMDSEGIYRYINTISSTKTLANYLDFVDGESFLDSINNPHEKTDLGKPSTVETLAYRVEKIGGSPREVIQNFWFVNTTKLDEFQFLDSQVKYGEEYTYNVYAYVLVAGYRYQASQLRVTRKIAEIDGSGPSSTERPPGWRAAPSSYCLEFYNPETGEAQERWFIDEATSILDENEFATNAQIVTPHKYLADYNISIQPSLKLMEMPITSKTLKVLDNPANTVSAQLFHPEDASHKIGFDIEYDTFVERPFPETLTADNQYKLDYLNANNLLEDTPLPNETVSKPRYMEVYRMQEKPKLYSDFDSRVHKTFDLKMPESKQTFKEHVFYDKVKTSQKYYYMLRFLNEHRDPSRPSLIYEAELVDDGGYLYTIFDTLFLEDLEVETFVKPSISFKKLINLSPAYAHTLFNDSGVDYTQEAHTQFANLKVGATDELIWGKKFKIRLTSKKTGKKIDLNITYNLRSE